MGGIRAQPLLTKQSFSKEGPTFAYAVASMCGTFDPIKVGDYTWKTLISPQFFQTKRLIFSEYSMDMEVNNNSIRTLGLEFCRKAFC